MTHSGPSLAGGSQGVEMFRRFMIICWVLFGITASASAALAVYSIVKSQEKDAIIASTGKSNFLDASVYLRDRYIDLGWRFAELKDPSRQRQDGTWPDPPYETASEAAIEKAYTEYKNAEELSDRLGSALNRATTAEESSLALVVLGAIFLIWNIIWHIGHWLWLEKARWAKGRYQVQLQLADGALWYFR